MGIKQLPDAEFEAMKAIWHMHEPITSAVLTEHLRRALPQKDWKAQTVLTMLTRLEKKGFLRSEKNGKEREYFALVSEQDYLQVEQEAFRKRFSVKSFGTFVKALYDDDCISDEELQELKDWINGI